MVLGIALYFLAAPVPAKPAEADPNLVVTQPPNQPPVFTSVPVTTATVGTSSETPQLFDLSKWSVVQYEFVDQPDASWVLSENNTVATQTENSAASILVSDFELSCDEIQGTWSVQSASDDDFIGFVFGYADRQHFYLFDWKRADQDGKFGLAQKGMSVKVVSAGSDLRETDIWPTPPLDPVRAHSIYHNAIRYEDFKEYQFTLVFRPGDIKITIKDGATILADINLADNTYTTGKFGFYNESQENVRYAGFKRTALQTTPYFYDADASDPDGNSLTYALTTAPCGMTIDPVTAIVQWSPTASQIGEHNVSIQADDGGGGTAIQAYVVTVLERLVNHPPVITSQPTTTVTAGESYSYNVNAIDPDNDTLTFRLIIAPPGLTIDSASGAIYWNPAGTDVGKHAIRLVVEDGRDGFADQAYVLVVTKPNQPPVFTSVPVTTATVGTSSETPQRFDLSKWSVVQYKFVDQRDASWVLSENNTVATQTLNSAASILESDFELSCDEIQGTWSVQSASDDDFIGFVFGYADRQHFYLFDWKRADQDGKFGLAQKGMNVKVVSDDPSYTVDNFEFLRSFSFQRPRFERVQITKI